MMGVIIWHLLTVRSLEEEPTQTQAVVIQSYLIIRCLSSVT